MDITFVSNIDEDLYISDMDKIRYLNIYQLFLNMTKELREYEDMMADFDFMDYDDRKLFEKATIILKERKKNLENILRELEQDYEEQPRKSALRDIKEFKEDIQEFNNSYDVNLLSLINSFREMKNDPALKTEYQRVLKKYNKTVDRLSIIKKAIDNPEIYLNPDYLLYLSKHCIDKKYSPIQETTNFLEMYFCQKFHGKF
jgi:vacuolar-type H+-ATPase subunit I/STV1